MKGTARFTTLKAAAISSLFLVLASPAYADGLTKARGFAMNIRDELIFWTPIAAIIAGLLGTIAYWLRIVQKEFFVNWLIGLIIAGSIVEIVAMFLPSN